jgi:hypothetical protein
VTLDVLSRKRFEVRRIVEADLPGFFESRSGVTCRKFRIGGSSWAAAGDEACDGT